MAEGDLPGWVQEVDEAATGGGAATCTFDDPEVLEAGAKRRRNSRYESLADKVIFSDAALKAAAAASEPAGEKKKVGLHSVHSARLSPLNYFAWVEGGLWTDSQGLLATLALCLL